VLSNFGLHKSFVRKENNNQYREQGREGNRVKGVCQQTEKDSVDIVFQVLVIYIKSGIFPNETLLSINW